MRGKVKKTEEYYTRKSGKKFSPNRGGKKNNNRGGPPKKKTPENELTWSVDPDTKELVIHNPPKVTERLAKNFPQGVVFQSEIAVEPWSDDSDLESSDTESESDMDSDLEKQFHDLEEEQFFQNKERKANDELILLDYIQVYFSQL
eukprot:TRINITY_DN1237_c0_g2_i2.p1 TRINITY_DN1237_c0_g2~~TRINITY_DN1237_c0_g2_i2.p1  ORF type:complete len:146 (+),score=37.86 TRINITY_DN1237_c0_g2_i2:62-499(+)